MTVPIQAVEQAKPVAYLPVEVPLSPEEEADLSKYLELEIGQYLSARRDLVKRIVELKQAYHAPKPQGEKNFPFKRASQITIPIGKMIVNVVAPRLIDELVRADPVWSVRSSHKASALDRVASEGEHFLDLYANRRMKIERKIETMILEGTKLGTHVFEVVEDQEHRQTARYSDDGMTIGLVDEEVSIGPQWHPIPLEDFVWKYGFTDLQEMPYCGKILHFTDRQVFDRMESGKYRKNAVAEILQLPGTTLTQASSDVVIDAEKREFTKPSFGSVILYDIFQLYLYWPIRLKDAEGKEKVVVADLLVDWYQDRRKILSVRLNPWWHKMRPLLYWNYMPVEYRILGEGAIEQAEQFQEEITAMHRLRLDNQTLAGMRMIVISRMVEGLGPGDPLYPGKVIKAQNATDVQPFQLADIYPSTVLNENLSMAFVERVTGVNEATLGRAMPVTRTTATAQVSLLEEQAKRFSMTIRQARGVIGQAGEFAYDLFHQFGTGGLAAEWLGPTRGQLVELLFSIERDRVVSGFSVRIMATSPKVNKQLDMQSNLQLFNLMVSLHTQLINMIMSLGPQFAGQVMPLIARALVSSSKRFMTRVLDSFDESDPEGVLQALSLLEMVLPDPSRVFGGKQLDEQTLQQAIAELRPDLVQAMSGAMRAGTEDAMASALSVAGGGNGARLGKPPAGGVSPLAPVNPLLSVQ